MREGEKNYRDRLTRGLRQHARRVVGVERVVAADHVLEEVVALLVRLHGVQRVSILREKTHLDTLHCRSRLLVVGMTADAETRDLKYLLVLTARHHSFFIHRHLFG